VNRRINRFAAEELAQAARFYKREAGVGLARWFLAEFERVLGLVKQHPGLGTPNNDGRRTHGCQISPVPSSTGLKAIPFASWSFDTRVLILSAETVVKKPRSEFSAFSTAHWLRAPLERLES
jgi:hypothetical protein